MASTKKETLGYYGTGRRKEAIARVWLKEQSEKSFTVNEKPYEQFFTRETLRMIVNQPLELANVSDKFQIRAMVDGGGPSGQAGAVRLGIARALLQFDSNLRSTLRRGGLLTRDPREKERKKYGRRGARRSFQYTKR